MKRGIKVLTTLEEAASAIFMVAILGLVSLQALGRYIFLTPPVWTDEIARLGLIWVTFVGSTFVMARGQHITVHLFASRLTDRTVRFLDSIAAAIVFATTSVYVVGAYSLMRSMHRVASPAAGFPRSLVYAAAVTGLALMALHALVLVFRPPSPHHIPSEDEAQLTGD